MSVLSDCSAACVNLHVDWSQMTNDLATTLGLQSHDVVGWCFLMLEDIQNDISSGQTMKQHHAAVNRCPKDDQKCHMDELKVLMKDAGSVDGRPSKTKKTGRKDKLKQREQARLVAEGVSEADANAQKHIQRLSEAPFKLE